MKKSNNGTAQEAPVLSSAASQHEDAMMKVMMQFFSEEMLPLFGIPGKVASFAPTESVSLEIHKSYEDFNLVMEDGSWKHFEFQSTNGGAKDLKRFRFYEASMSYFHGVTITTYVLFSGRIKNPMTELSEGINTYRIHPIIMQDRDADTVIRDLREMEKSGRSLAKADLIPLALCPLMGGESPMKDRILSAFDILRNAKVSPEDSDSIEKLEAVIYTMAEKFLEKVDIEDVRKGVAMTRLGQMIFRDGEESGFKRGMEHGIECGIERGMERGIAAMIQENVGEGTDKAQILQKLQKHFQLNPEVAESYYLKYHDTAFDSVSEPV